MQTANFLVKLYSNNVKQVVSTSGETIYHCRANASAFGTVIKVIGGKIPRKK
jgi:hypothetical protein